jgi:hypothetical protein
MFPPMVPPDPLVIADLSLGTALLAIPINTHTRLLAPVFRLLGYFLIAAGIYEGLGR